jgi:hypothetical protein
VASLANAATVQLLQLLTAPTGLNTTITTLALAANVGLAPIAASQFFTDNVSSAMAEQSEEIKYTAVYIYCEKITNTLKEKFRSFSGYLQMVIDVRVSQDRLNGIDQVSQLYSEAVAQTLNQIRGDWGQGLFYAGAYDISFGPVKHGGKNFIKGVTISFQLNASID